MEVSLPTKITNILPRENYPLYSIRSGYFISAATVCYDNVCTCYKCMDFDSLGAYAQARYTVVYLHLCVCVFRLLQLLNDQLSASKSLYRLLVMFSWILILGFAK